ncbi:selenide, water dikinase SelD [Uliginosibacterium sp. H1]|uniref:selenide, water dikinase SelD n=1 Tax=Uliginosibacterium sp. H1 TaxID=3114757 RepID=UPI002E19353E|nr:selenide, water dikinase SelD [Uliginosibacterium sp. H1]
MTKRFLDWASHGGCSNKACVSDLRQLLTIMGNHGNDYLRQDSSRMRDAASFSLPSNNVVATIDVVLPYVPSVVHFARIAVNHILNDIYATHGVPAFALALLGIPKGMDGNNPIVAELMLSAQEALRDEGALLVGGHTMAHQEDLYLGLSVVGTAASMPNTAPLSQGDILILTKRLGTSVASVLWRTEPMLENDFEDVIHGMLRSNRITSSILRNFGIQECTDVSGFGLARAAHSLTNRLRCSAKIYVEKLPIYASIEQHLKEELTTRQYLYNCEDAAGFSINMERVDDAKKCILFDSQMSGGMLFACPRHLADKLVTQILEDGDEATAIGEIYFESVGAIKWL